MSETTQAGGPAGGGTGKPGRYTRSTGGLIGSMIVLVLVVLGIVVFRGGFRDTPNYQAEPIDYRDLVISVQQAGLKPAYPPTLPHGWYAKDASFLPGERPVFDLVFATDDQHTAGIHQENASARDLVSTYVGTAASEDGDVHLDSPLASTWTAWTDTDGDHAYTTRLGEETLLVYSSGDHDALTSFTESLTTAKLDPRGN